MRCDVSINGQAPVPGDLEVHVERIDVTMETVTGSDLSWEHVDQQGHFHAWTTDGELPTLSAHTKHRPCDGIHAYGLGDPDNCDGYDVMLYRCAICGDTVEPATISRPGPPESIPGRMSWSVEVRQHLPNRGDMVSVLLDVGHEVAFGIGIVRGVTHASGTGPERPVVWTRISGTSPLGRRKAPAAAVAQ